jgi:quercetin 2,3-dioxygenase
MTQRKVVSGVHAAGSNHWVGDGFPVRNLFPSNGVSAEVNPFLMLDYAGPKQFEPSGQPRGVGEHPHRGFETITIAYQGSVDHRDSSGNSGTIYPGDVQWMTAASGLVHEEKHGREFTRQGGVFEMVQLWLNLPKAHKMDAPGYQSITSAQIPKVELGELGELGGASYARVIAGECNGVSGPARTFTPVNVFDLRVAQGSRFELQLPEGHNVALFLLSGAVAVNGEALSGEAQLAVLGRTGRGVEIEGREESTMLLLSGEPIDEPVASYGPFVMNTKAELQQAMEDYRAGRMGRLAS